MLPGAAVAQLQIVAALVVDLPEQVQPRPGPEHRGHEVIPKILEGDVLHRVHADPIDGEGRDPVLAERIHVARDLGALHYTWLVAEAHRREALALLGLVDTPLAPPKRPFECLRLAEVIDRHAEGDRFVKTWTSFDPLAEGELIAVRADGSELRAPRAGYIVFPDVGAQPGHEWFYLAGKSDRPL